MSRCQRLLLFAGNTMSLDQTIGLLKRVVISRPITTRLSSPIVWSRLIVFPANNSRRWQRLIPRPAAVRAGVYCAGERGLRGGGKKGVEALREFLVAMHRGVITNFFANVMHLLLRQRDRRSGEGCFQFVGAIRKMCA